MIDSGLGNDPTATGARGETPPDAGAEDTGRGTEPGSMFADTAQGVAQDGATAATGGPAGLDNEVEPPAVTSHIEYSVDNMGRRAMAAVVDMIILASLYFVVAILYGKGYKENVLRGFPGGGQPVRTATTLWTLGGLGFVIYLCCCFAYFIVLEWALRASIGKLLFGLRVVNAQEERITPWQSLGRNILRAIDGFPYGIPYLVGYITAGSDSTHQRIGDRVAGTYVIDST